MAIVSGRRSASTLQEEGLEAHEDANRPVHGWVMANSTAQGAKSGKPSPDSECRVPEDGLGHDVKGTYPETHKALHDGPMRDHRDIAWRQLHMSSELLIKREIKARNEIASWLRPKSAGNMEPLGTSSADRRQTIAPLEDAWPSADCELRPAESGDFEDIIAIINAERQRENCPQVLESKPVSASDVRRLFFYCKRMLRPFIVAIPREEDFMDQSKWPKGSEKTYREFVEFKRSKQAPPGAVVVGFAFVTVTHVGLLNRPCPGARFTGLIRLLVHPDHRRRL